MKKLLLQWGLSLFSIRFLVMALAMLLLTGLIPMTALNQFWLHTSNQLFHEPPASTGVAAVSIVQLDSKESSSLLAHPVLEPRIFNLLEQQIRNGGKAVLLLQQPPLLTPDQLAPLLGKKQLQSRLQRMQAWEKSRKIQFGIATRPSNANTSITAPLDNKQKLVASSGANIAGDSIGGFGSIQSWLNKQPPQLNPIPTIQPFALWPFAGIKGLSYPLLWQNGQDYYSDFTLRTLQLANPTTLTWTPNQGLNDKTNSILSGSDATLFPLIDNDASSANQPPRYSLSQATRRANPKQLLIIGAMDDPQLEPFAQTINAILHQHYLRTPPWLSAISWLSILAITLYLLCVLPLLSMRKGIALTLFVFIGVLASHISLQLIYSYWVAIAAPITLLFAGFVLMTIHNRQQHRFDHLSERYQHRSLQLGSALYHQGSLDEASQAIADCDTSDAQLTLSYDIALQQEQTQELDTALLHYQHIQQRQKNFKDVGERIDKLNTQLGNSSPTLHLASTQTMVLPEQPGMTPHLGRYEIIREIGRGAMGIVYLGRDPRIARTVAIKTLPYDKLDASSAKEMKQRFFREAEAAGRLNHPNIVTIFDMGEEQSMAFIAMDFAKGTPLNKFCKPQSLLPVATVYKIVADVADALSYAHQQKIVHRDIKPGNIVFDPDSKEVKVTDFGIARISDDSQTKTGSVMGSPLYMSPEQLKGSKVTGTADIYSLGVTFYQLLTGAVPFDGDSLANLTYQIINSKYKSVRSIRADLPASATRIINKALQKEASKRYQNAAEMAEALRKSMQKEFARELA